MKNFFRGIRLAMYTGNLPEFVGRFKDRRSPRIRLHPNELVFFRSKEGQEPEKSLLRVYSLSFGGVGLVERPPYCFEVGDSIDGCLEVRNRTFDVRLYVVYKKDGELGCRFIEEADGWETFLRAEYPIEIRSTQIYKEKSYLDENGYNVTSYTGSLKERLKIYEDSLGPAKVAIFFDGTLIEMSRDCVAKFTEVGSGEEIEFASDFKGEIPSELRYILELIILNVPELTIKQRHFMFDSSESVKTA